MEITKQIYCKDRKEWRKWLSQNHSSEKEIWLIYFKKHTNKSRVPYNDAVEEALCFGWIDSTVKRIDDEKYCQRFTPRRKNSGWSEHNKKRVKKIIKEKRMTNFGLEKVKEAKGNGKWNEIVSQINFEIPDEFMITLDNNKTAKQNFDVLSRSHKNQYINWIASAKKSETRFRRSNEAVKMLEQNKKLGFK